MKRQNEKAPIIKPFFRPPGGMKSARSDHPALTGSPPNSGGEEITEEPHQEGKKLLQRRTERTKREK